MATYVARTLVERGDVKLSVALCTHDGEAHLGEQLDTILGQTRQPDELVVVDGGSTDGTDRILRRFAAQVDFPVAVHAGGPAGASANFARAISLCTGDHIALSGQGDRWMAERLATGERVLRDLPDAMLVFSDAHLITHAGAVLHRRQWRAIGFGRREFETMMCDPLAAMLRRPPVTGCTVTFRRDIIDLALPFPPGMSLQHDRWLALCAAAVGSIAPLSTPLATRRVESRWPGRTRDRRTAPDRRVSGGGLGGRRQHDDRRRLAVRDQAALLQVRLAQRGVESPEVMATLEDFAEFCEFREAVLKRATRPAAVLRRLRAGDYHRFAGGWASAAADLLRTAPARRVPMG